MTDTISKINPTGWRSVRTVVDSLGAIQHIVATQKWVDTFEGFKNPSWKQQVRDHLNATTAAQGVRTTVEEIPGRAISRSHWVNSLGAISHVVEESMSGSLAIPTIMAVNPTGMAYAATLAAGRFYAKASAAVQRSDIAESAAEYKQTVKALQHRGTQLFRTFPRYVEMLIDGVPRFYRVPLKRRKIEIIKWVSDSYLEWNLGWRPAISDIGKIIDELSTSDPVLDYSRIKASAVSDPSSVLEEFTVVSSGNLNVECHMVGKSWSSVRYEGVVLIQKSLGVGKLRGNFGLTLENFVPTLYQLLPYSFVADYFSNLGQVINSLCFLQSRLGWTCVSQRNESETITSSIRAYNSASVPPTVILVQDQLELAPYTARVRKVSFTRSAAAAPPVPSLVFHLPNRTSQWATIGALLGARSRKWTSLISSIL